MVHRTQHTSLFETLHAGPAVLVLAAGLLLYLAGFFAPLRGTGTPGPPPPGCERSGQDSIPNLPVLFPCQHRT